MADRVGTQVGNYRLTHLLGQGGFAEVYLGEHIHLGTQAAIKLLHAPLASAGEVEKFRQEARLIATLQHPHILRVLEFGIEAGQPYLVLEHARGGSLRQRHPTGTQVLLATVVSYVQQIAQALQYAHDQKLIHRDIKPQNLLVGRNGEILLSDFGISVVAESTSRQQAYGFAGTVAYSAPEQLQEYPRPASDQYALGIVVYEWLTGTLPFTGAFQEIIAKHLYAAPPSLREQLPSLPAAVEQVVLTALAKDPKERFASVSTFATALKQASQPTVPAPSVVAPAPNMPSHGNTQEDMQALPPAIGASTTNLASPSAPLVVSLPPTEQRSPEAHSSPAMPVATEAALKRGPQAPASPPTLASTQTLLPPPTAPVPTSLHPRRPALPRRQQPVGRALAVGILLLLLVGGSLVGLGLAGNGPLAGLGAKVSATATRQAASTATTTPLPVGSITEFALHTAGSNPRTITKGPDGNLWFTMFTNRSIERFSPSGQITGEFSLPEQAGEQEEMDIAAGPDGNLWFTLSFENQIGRITPSGSVTRFSIPTPNSMLFGITRGPDDNLWFTENESRKIGRITTDGRVTEFPKLPDSLRGPAEITTGTDGNLWFTADYSGAIGRLTPEGQITSFQLSGGPAGITAGPDGNLWFGENGSNKIGRITTDGRVTEFPLPPAAHGPNEITAHTPSQPP